MAKKKRRLTQSEEFDILKLVLDKFLWLGFGIMAFGLYHIFVGDFSGGLTWIIIGAIVLILFMVLIVMRMQLSREASFSQNLRDSNLLISIISDVLTN